MKNFKFKYESILNLMENKEDSVKNKLSEAYNILHSEKNKLDTLEVKGQEYSELIRNKTSLGCKLFILKNMEGYRNDLNSKISFQNNVIFEKEQEINSIRNELIEISKERKIMEKLKERKLDDFNMTLKKNEEKNIDQLVTYKNSLMYR